MSHADRVRWEEKYARAGHTDAAPSRFVRTHVDLLRGRVLDIAAGAGRNALWLARQGATVHALDIALGGLQRARAAARSEGLAVDCVQVDLEDFLLPDEAYDAVIDVRFLQRSLFEPMKRAVRRGGVVLIETFLIDQQQIGHPNHPDFLLQRGELARAFRDFEILALDEGLFEDDGFPAYLGRLLARRPR